MRLRRLRRRYFIGAVRSGTAADAENVVGMGAGVHDLGLGLDHHDLWLFLVRNKAPDRDADNHQADYRADDNRRRRKLGFLLVAVRRRI